MYIISESFIQWAFAMAMASLSRVRRKSCSRRSRHSNYQPNRPPTSVLLVLKIKFLANILANVRCVIKGIAEVASFGTRRPVCPATENHVLGDIKNPRPEKSRHIRSRGGRALFSQYHSRLSEIQLALWTIVGVGLFGNFETEAHNVSAHAVERTSRFLQPLSLFAIRSALRRLTSSAAIAIWISQHRRCAITLPHRSASRSWAPS